MQVDLFVEGTEDKRLNKAPDVMTPLAVGEDSNGKYQINHNVVPQMYPILAGFYSDELIHLIKKHKGQYGTCCWRSFTDHSLARLIAGGIESEGFRRP